MYRSRLYGLLRCRRTTTTRTGRQRQPKRSQAPFDKIGRDGVDRLRIQGRHGIGVAHLQSKVAAPGKLAANGDPLQPRLGFVRRANLRRGSRPRIQRRHLVGAAQDKVVHRLDLGSGYREIHYRCQSVPSRVHPRPDFIVRRERGRQAGQPAAAKAVMRMRGGKAPNVTIRSVVRHILRIVTAALLVAAPALCTSAGLPRGEQAALVPESGFVSPASYTNGYFGFSLPLPKAEPFRTLNLWKNGAPSHFLFGLVGQEIGLATLVISARESKDAVAEAQQPPPDLKKPRLKRVEIGGREFQRAESDDSGPAGKARQIRYATAVRDYVLEFAIISFNPRLTAKLERSVESLAFFDPALAAEKAGPNSQPYDPAAAAQAAMPNSKRIHELQAGSVSGNNYTNEDLGIGYEFPAGWVVPDQATQDKIVEAGHRAAWGDSPAAARDHQMAEQCSRRLLWVTKDPEGSQPPGQVNPLIVLLAFDPACAPGAQFPASLDDREGIKRTAKQVVDSLAGSPFAPKGATAGRAYTIQGHLMIEIPANWAARTAGGTVQVWTTIFVTAVKDYWIVLGIMSGTPGEQEELGKTKLGFR